MGPFKCPECGIWWAGLEHRCRIVPPADGANGYLLIDDGYIGAGWVRPYVGPMRSGSTTLAPWCAVCGGFHVPGAGPCTASYCMAPV